MFLTFSNFNKTNYGYTRCGMCLNPSNLNNINYYYNRYGMCIISQTRMKLIIVIENMANCRYKENLGMNKMVSPARRHIKKHQL